MSDLLSAALERKFFEKLGIEDKHEYLANVLPLYKKLTLAIIPPLQNSLDYIHSEYERAKGDDLGPKENPEDIDVAFALGDGRALTSFVNMLTTALACATMEFRQLRNIIYDRHKFPSIGGIVGYSYDSDNESASSAERDSVASDRERDSLRRALTHPVQRVQTGTYNSLMRTATKLRAALEEPSAKFLLQLIALVLGDEHKQVPPAKHRTPWQNSVIERIELAPAAFQALLHCLEDDNYTESEESRASVAYHLANKIHDAFDLYDDDHFHNRFECWLIRDVLLQGHIYVTRDAVCFYLLMPGVFSETELSDPDLTIHLGAVGYKMAHYGDSYFALVYAHRFWLVLKPQTLSIYNSPTKQYFPLTVIDLHKAMYCEIVPLPEKQPTSPAPLSSPPTGDTTPRFPFDSSDVLLLQLDSEVSSMAEHEEEQEALQSGAWFRVVCTDKTYRFHTGSIYSARHWYNSITKAIFQIHNTNSQREVLLKIPINDILEFHKNYVLADGSIDDSDFDDDTPMSFSIKYHIPHHESTFEKFKLKTKKSEDVEYDFVHFLVFRDGRTLYDLFSEVYDANCERNDSLTPASSRFVLRARRMFGDDVSTTSTSSTQSHSIVSTLQPEFSSGETIVDKVATGNELMLKQRALYRYKYENGDDKEPPPGEQPGQKRALTGPITKLKTIKRKYLSKSPSENNSSPAFSMPPSEVPTPRFSPYLLPPEYSEGGQTLLLPKSFSLMSLRNLDMLMITKKRTYKEVEARYKGLACHTPMKNVTVINPHQPETIGEEQAEDLIAERELGEFMTDTPTSQEANDDDDNPRKKSKLKSIKRSIKTVSTMGGVWSANPEHYCYDGGEDEYFVVDSADRAAAVDHFRKHFSLGDDSELVATWYAHLKRYIPVFGKVYLGNDKLYFRSMLPGVSTKMILPLKNVINCSKKSGAMLHYSTLMIKMQGTEEYFLEFGNAKARNDCQSMILSQLAKEGYKLPLSDSAAHMMHGFRGQEESEEEDFTLPSKTQTQVFELAKARVRAARLRLWEDKISSASGIDFPLILEDDPFAFTEVKSAKAFNITLLTIGSRGDVQPYIALGKGLLAEGHNVTIATHAEFQPWVEKHGIGFKEIAGNPTELMQLMVTHGSMSVSFLKEASANFKGWINELLTSSWEACQGTDLLIESPSAMGGIHIAEALGIPYMRAFTMPWTRTRAYPHAFIVPDQKRGGSYNFLTHVMFENVFWKGISGQVNKWRVETLGLGRTSLVKLQQSKIPFLYNVSPAMFPPSVDFPDWVKVTGYWFLDEGDDTYEPPEGLVEFLQTARDNDEKVVYIGFGSIVVRDAKALTKTIVKAVVDLGVKCILNKGWSDRLGERTDPGEDVEDELPPQIFNAGTVPHDWLFPRIDAAVHHGGSGTVGATLRTGLPTVIKPFFGDQFFYASRVEDLGVGIALKNLNAKSLTKALRAITTEEKYKVKAAAIATAMESETGVLTAIAAIYSELAYAKSLIMNIRQESKKSFEDKSGIQTPNEEEFDLDSSSDEDSK